VEVRSLPLQHNIKKRLCKSTIYRAFFILGQILGQRLSKKRPENFEIID